MKRMLLLALFVIAVCGIYNSTGTTIPVPPEKKEICATWIGFDAEAVMFYRLTLTEKGGLFASSYPKRDVGLFKVTAWSLDKGKLTMSVDALTKAEPIRISGEASVNWLTLTIGGADGGWSRKVRLYREDAVEDRMKAVKKAMEHDGAK